MAETSVGRRLLFAYGSLKRGGANHDKLGGARFVGVAHTVPCFALRQIAGYPALASGRQAVRGELFEVTLDELAELDEFEGSAYVRGEIELGDGRSVFAYLAREPSSGTPLDADEWPAIGV